MRRKWKTICAAAIIISCAAAGCIYYYNHVFQITESDINAYINKTDSASKLKSSILRSVLLNTGQWREWRNPGKIKVSVILSRIKGRQKDAVIVARGGIGKNVIALYEKRNGKFKYTVTVDTFADLRDVQIMPLREQGGSVIAIREHNGGSLEEGSYIRIYAWDEGKFQNVLSIPEKYVAYYNENKNSDKPGGNANWIKVSERNDVLWENSDAPVVHVLQHQSFSLSAGVNRQERPDDSDFEIVRNRDIFENYIWSGKWMHFILFEGTDRSNGEPVAVIEDLSGSPYGLIGQYSETGGKYRVKYIDGTIETVDKDRIKPGIEVKKARRI